MPTVHELIIKLTGKSDSSASSMFKKLSSDSKNLEERFKKLSNLQIKATKFENLNSTIAATKNRLDGATKSAAELKKKYEASSQATDKLGRSFKEADARAKTLEIEIANTKKPSDELKREFKLAKIEARDLKKEFNESNRETKALGSQMRSADGLVTNLTNKLDDQKKSAAELSKSLKDAGINTDSFKDSQARLNKQLEYSQKFQSSLKNFKDSKEKLAGSSAEFLKNAAKTTAAFAVPIKFAMDKETTNAEIRKVADFADAESEKRLHEAITRMTTQEIPMTYKEMGELIAAGAQGGIETTDLEKFGGLASKMAVAFDLDPQAAGQYMANWKAAFQMNMDDLKVLGDQVNYLGNTSAANAESITNIINRVGALGDVAGVKANQVAALGASMVEMGVDDNVAATGIKKVLTTLAGGPSKMLKKYGFDGEQLAKDMVSDGAGTIIKVFEKLSKMSQDKQTKALKDIFGQQNIGAIAPLLSQLDSVKTNLDKVSDSSKYAGSMQAEFEAQAATTANQLRLVKEQAKNGAAAIGEVLLPEVKKGADKFGEMAQKANKWAKENPEMFKKLIKGVAIFAGSLVGLKGLKVVGDSFKVLKDGMSLMHNRFKLVASGDTVAKIISGVNKVKGVFGGLFSFIAANPMVLVIGAVIGGLIALSVWIYKNKDAVKDFINSAKAKFDEYKGKLDENVSKVTEFADSAWSEFKRAGGAVADFLLTPLRKAHDLLEKVKSKVNSIKEWGSDKISSASTWIHNRVPGLASGGVVTGPQLTVVGEGGDHEAVIPLNNHARSKTLWEYAGKRMGLLNTEPRLKPVNSGLSAATGSNVSVTLQIDARGAQKGVEQEINNAIKYATPELKRTLMSLLSDIDRDRQRTVLN